MRCSEQLPGLSVPKHFYAYRFLVANCLQNCQNFKFKQYRINEKQ